MSFLETRNLPHYTNYLGYIASKNNNPLHLAKMRTDTLTIENPISKDIMGQYEATITYCCYHSRLMYENRPRKIITIYNFLNFSPLVFNKALSVVTFSDYKDVLLLKSKGKLVETNTKEPSGFLIYDKQDDLPVSVTMFDYTKTPSKIFPNEKIIVIAFRGSLSLQNIFKDGNAVTETLFNVYPEGLFSDVKTYVDNHPELRKSYVNISGLINPFGAHRGFVSGMKNVYNIITEKLFFLLKTHPDVSRILKRTISLL